jgi:hypothetical protein
MCGASMNNTEGEKSVLIYVGIFGLTYFVLRLVLSLFLLLMHAEYYKTILVIGSSAALAAYKFLQDNHRPFSNREKFRIIFGSFLCLLVINLTYLTREKMIFGDGIGFLFIFDQGIDLLFLWFIFGPVTKSVYQRRQQSNKH